MRRARPPRARDRRRRLGRRPLDDGFARAADAQRRGPAHLKLTGQKPGAGQLDAAAGASHPGLDPQRAEGYRPHELDREPRQQHPLLRVEPLERAGQQGRRSTAVLGLRIPGPARDLARYEQLAVRCEDGLVAHPGSPPTYGLIF